MKRTCNTTGLKVKYLPCTNTAMQMEINTNKLQ